MANGSFKDPKKALIFAFVMTFGIMALVAIPLIIVFVFIYPPPGDEIASKKIEPGKPFALTYESDGKPQRVWVDAHCFHCSANIAKGKIRVVVKGKTIATHEVTDFDEGFSMYHYEGPGEVEVESHLLFEVPAQKKGRKVKLRGKLGALEPTTLWSSDPSSKGPSARFETLRIFVAP